MVVNMVLVW